MLVRAAAGPADAVFLDLEDAVAPGAKDSARLAAGRALRDLDWGDKIRAARVNGVDTPWCHRDLVSLLETAGDALDLVILPKVTAERDVWFADTLLTQLEAGLGLVVGGIGLELLVEEAAALAGVETLARCCPRTTSVVLGTADLAASLRLPAEVVTAGDPETWRGARSRVVAAARAAGVEPVDGPYGALDDPTGCRRDAVAARAAGMAGKWVIHPDQIPIVNDVFTPTPDEVRTAVEVVRALESAAASGAGAARHAGRLIDAATGRIHREILRIDAEIGRREQRRHGG
ncbi:hypothetical protein CIK06_17840 [Plantactinospora sp. KBS50]|nr:hypothetical protein CIK06_17840 [Plantactinospora sp. KBS50]